MLAVKYFCTYFDDNYLPQGMAMYRSLRRVCPDAHVFVLCLSEECLSQLKALALPDVTLISIGDLEAGNDELCMAKKNRTRVEYIFTCTPCLCLYVLERFSEVDMLTYLDADLYFFSSIQPLYEEFGEACIGIIPHNFASPRYLRFGRFNVGWITFRRGAAALECATWWRDRCIEWCKDQVEDTRYADQKYLDQWPARFKGVHVYSHKGANLARWNIKGVRIIQKDNGIWVDGQRLIFFHFAGFRKNSNWLYECNFSTHWVSPSRLIRQEIFGQYIAELRVITGPSQIAVKRRQRIQDFIPQKIPILTRRIIRVARSLLLLDYVTVFSEERLIEKFADKIYFPAQDHAHGNFGATQAYTGCSPISVGSESSGPSSRGGKIIFDGSAFSLQKMGGVSRYLYEVAGGIARLGTVGVQINLYPGWSNNYLARDLSEIVVTKQLTWFDTGWPFHDWCKRSEEHGSVVHSPYLNLPKQRDGQINILTVHDLILQKVISGPRSWLRVALFETALKRADHIVCVSNYTKRRLLETRPELKRTIDITVIPNGLSQIFRDGKFDAVNTGRDYLLYVGSRVSYKGYSDLINAFVSAKLHEKFALICVGGGAFSRAERRFLEKSGVVDDVIHKEHVTDDNLGALYCGAIALIYPSKEEGFGIPLLEAMSCECPIVARDIPVFREVAGQIPWYLPAITSHALGRVLDEITRGDHHARLACGRSRALEYSWTQTAVAHLRLFQSLLPTKVRGEK